MHNWLQLFLSYHTWLYVQEREWKEECFNKLKLRFYNLFKSQFEPDTYVLWDVSKCLGSIFAQFRLGILPLEVEDCRFRDVPLELRVCRVCQSGEGEYEIHFLCVSSSYQVKCLTMVGKAIAKCPEFGDMDDFYRFIFLCYLCKGM